MNSETLYFKNDSSDKVYALQVVPQGSGFVVAFQFGPRNGTLQSGYKTKGPVPKHEAETIFDKVLREKLAGGYMPTKGSKLEAPAKAASAERTPFIAEELTPITDKVELEFLQNSPKHWLQVKLDGHRRQVMKTKDGISGFNKLGEPRDLPADLVRNLEQIPLKSFFMDGELIGNKFYACDLLMEEGENLARQPYKFRYERLCDLINSNGYFQRAKSLVQVVITWTTTEAKKRGLKSLYDNRAEGAVWKLFNSPHCAGRSGPHKKLKFQKTCSCIVLEVGSNGKQSVDVGLYDGKELRYVAACSTIGKTVPKRGDVVEVRYLYGTEDKKLYQPHLERIRDDVRKKDCTIGQLIYKAGVMHASQ